MALARNSFVASPPGRGWPQALFAVVVCIFCLADTGARREARRGRRRLCGRKLKAAGSQTLSPLPDGTGQPTRSTASAWRLMRPKRPLDAMPVAHGGDLHLWRTVGSAILVRPDRPQAPWYRSGIGLQSIRSAARRHRGDGGAGRPGIVGSFARFVSNPTAVPSG